MCHIASDSLLDLEPWLSTCSSQVLALQLSKKYQKWEQRISNSVHGCSFISVTEALGMTFLSPNRIHFPEDSTELSTVTNSKTVKIVTVGFDLT